MPRNCKLATGENLNNGVLKVQNQAFTQWRESFFQTSVAIVIVLFWLKWAGYLAMAGLNFLPLLFDRVSPFGM